MSHFRSLSNPIRALCRRACIILPMMLGLVLGTHAAAQQFCPMNLALIQPTADYDLTQNGGATVTHNRSGLTWMRCSAGQTWNGTTCQGTSSTLTWAAALVNAKNETSFGGGWRVPNITELRSIIESGCDSPAVNLSVFPATTENTYWSATTYAGDLSSTWNVNFALGDTGVSGKTLGQHVRLVRDGFAFGGFDAFGTVPDAPTIGTATAGNAQVTVAFTPPGNNGGSTITSYTATCGAQSNSGLTSPIVVSGLTNGVAVTCSVTATNDNGTSAASANSNSVTPLAFVALTGVKSRKTHATGTFDLNIATGVAITGAITVEPRVIGAGHLIVFQFDGPITATGTVTSVYRFAAPIGTPTAMASGNNVLVTLVGIPDIRRVTVALANVNAAGVNVSVSLGFYVGDVDSNRFVNTGDILQVKGASGSVTAANFRYDVNLAGLVNTADVLQVKGRSGPLP